MVISMLKQVNLKHYINILFGGFIATMLNIDKNMELVKNKIFDPNFAYDDSNEDIVEYKLKENEYMISIKTILYKEPDVTSKIICYLIIGEVIEIIQKQHFNNILWYNVKDNEGKKGWCILE